MTIVYFDYVQRSCRSPYCLLRFTNCPTCITLRQRLLVDYARPLPLPNWDINRTQPRAEQSRVLATTTTTCYLQPSGAGSLWVGHSSDGKAEATRWMIGEPCYSDVRPSVRCTVRIVSCWFIRTPLDLNQLHATTSLLTGSQALLISRSRFAGQSLLNNMYCNSFVISFHALPENLDLLSCSLTTHLSTQYIYVHYV